MLLPFWFGIILLNYIPEDTESIQFVYLYGNMMGTLIFGPCNWLQMQINYISQG